MTNNKNEKISEKKEQMMIAYKITGKDMTSLDALDVESIFNIMTSMYNSLTYRTDILKVEKNIESSNIVEYYQKLTDDLRKIGKENSSHDQVVIERKLEQLEGYQNDFYNMASGGAEFVNEYYIVLYEMDKTKLIEACESLELFFGRAQYVIEICDHYELINLCQRMVSPTALDLSPEDVEECKNDLSNFLSFKEIEFSPSHFKMGERLYQISAISEMPIKMPAQWIRPLIFNPCNFVISLTKFDGEAQRKLINKEQFRNAINSYTLTDRQVFENQEIEFQASIINEIASNITENKDKLFNCSITFLHESETEEELKEISNRTRNELIQADFKVDSLLYRQQEGLSFYVLKRNKNFFPNLIHVIPSSTLAIADIFVNAELNMPESLMLGVNQYGDKINWNPVYLTPKGEYTSHNGLVLGKIGGGKSFLMKKILNFLAAKGEKIIIIDVEAEFLNLGRYYNAKIINIGSGIGEMQNILQISPQLEDDTLVVGEEVKNLNHLKNSGYITDTINKVNEFFRFIYPEFTNQELSILREASANLYAKRINLNSDFNKLSATDWPIISDLIEEIGLLDVKRYSSIQQISLKNLYTMLQTDFLGAGVYAKMFNGHSSISISNNDFIIFNVKQLINKKFNKGLLNASMLLIFDLVYSEMNKLKLKNDILLPVLAKEKKMKTKMDAYKYVQKMIVVIDEFHVFIDDNNLYNIQTFSEIVKRCRKYYTGVWELTQQVGNLLDAAIQKYSGAIVENSQAKMIFNLGGNDLSKVKRLFESNGKGISYSDEVFVAGSKQGTGLFFYNPKDSVRIDITASETEIKAIDYRPN